MIPIKLTAPYYMVVNGRLATEAQLRIEAATERQGLLDARNWQNRANWRERFERDPLVSA